MPQPRPGRLDDPGKAGTPRPRRAFPDLPEGHGKYDKQGHPPGNCPADAFAFDGPAKRGRSGEHPEGAWNIFIDRGQKIGYYAGMGDRVSPWMV